MKKEIKANHVFEKTASRETKALGLAQAWWPWRLGVTFPSKFKLDIIQNIPEGEEISLYRNGEFTDLCAGPHVMRTGNIGAFKLTHVASAYYKGDEKNPQLQRIYGTAFKNKTQLDEYFAMLEEAKKRDHRKLGKELGFSPSTTTSAPASRSGSRAAPRSSTNSKSSRKRRSSPPVISASAPQTRARKPVHKERPPSLLQRVDVPADGIA